MHTLNSWKQVGRYFDYQGNKVFYVDEGVGKPIVLLHGYPTAGYDWVHIWDGLIDNNRLIAPDFIGFGFSDKPKNLNYSIHLQTDMVEALLAYLGVNEFHLVVHDYAVSVAQELISRQIDNTAGYKIHSVCLLNGGLIPKLHRPVLMQKLLLSPIGPLLSMLFNEQRFAKSFGQVFAPDKKPDAKAMHEFWELIKFNNGQAIIHKLLHYIADRRANQSRWVNAIVNPPMPVRLINGSLDPVSGKHLADGYRAIVKNPDIVELPTTGHYPQVESPAEVLLAIKEWIGN